MQGIDEAPQTSTSAVFESARRSSGGLLPRPLAWASLGLALAVCALACESPDRPAPAPHFAAAPIEVAACPIEPQRETRAPDVSPELERAEHWIAKLPAELVERELLDAGAREALASRVAELPGGWRDPLAEAVGDPALIEGELDERMTWLRERVSTGKYVETEAGALARAAARVEAAVAIEGLPSRFVVRETQLWCVPSTQGLYTAPIDLDFDRNRCASLHPGELVRTLRSSDAGAWIYVDAGHSVGWVDQREPTLGPALTADDARANTQDPKSEPPPRLWLLDDFEDLRAGSSFPLLAHDDEHYTILVPGLDGARERELPPSAPVSEAPLPLRPRLVYEQAFALLERGYGWGGRDGLRDCSRYLHDLFAEFGVRLPRNSAVQSKLGTRSVDLSELDEDQKREAIRAAAREGVVLLYMPGHIMLYLGQEGARDYGISALSEYLTPCPGGPDTVHRLDKVAVTSLELGRGTQRRAFIERISRMAVFAPS